MPGQKIGLRAFLFRRGVPGIASPACRCDQGDQTAAHLFAECTDAKSRAMQAMGFSTKGKVWEGLSDHKKAPGMARVFISTLTATLALEDSYKGFHPAGTVSLVDSTG